MRPGRDDGLGTFWQRLVRGTRWAWLDDRYRDALPADLPGTVMGLPAPDRLHAKQGRSTARVVFDGPSGPLPVYLKRHYRLPWPARVAALVDPAGRHTPGAAERVHLDRARRLGLDVPEVVAVGERIGPWGRLQGFLMVAELIGSVPLHEAIPGQQTRLGPGPDFERWKRRLARDAAAVAARLHGAGAVHKDLYLCHFYMDPGDPGGRLSLIDLHRLAEPRWRRRRWVRKDLAQLLFSTFGVAGLGDRDRLRFWSAYCRLTGQGDPRREARRVARKAAGYDRHNRRAISAGAGR